MACACKSGKREWIQLIQKIQHNAETFSFDFVSLESITWREGDSSNVFLKSLDSGSVVGKKFSYATLPSEKRIRFTTRIREERSDYKSQMLALNIGDFIEMAAPEGEFRLLREERPILLLSNGVGIATMRPFIKSFAENPVGIGRMTQINVDGATSIYEDEFESLEKGQIGFKSIYTKHRNEFYKALDTEISTLMFTTGKMPYFYLVGSTGFVNDVKSYLESLGFEEDDVLEDIQSSCGCASNKTNKMIKVKVTSRPKLKLSLPK